MDSRSTVQERERTASSTSRTARNRLSFFARALILPANRRQKIAGTKNSQYFSTAVTSSDRNLLGPQDAFYSRKVLREIDALLPLLGGQAHFDHVRQQGLQSIIVSVQVVEDAGRM